MEVLNIENELRDVVSRLITQVELSTKQGRTDMNLALEDAFIPILQSVFNLPNLINLNRKQKNYPGIDLGDDQDRVAFQVTSTTSLEKVKKTLKIFDEKQYYNSFDELYILTLVNKQKSYSQKAIDEITDNNFSFSAKDNIIDLSDILSLVTGLRLPAQKRILHEFKLVLGEVNSLTSLYEDAIPEQGLLTSNLVKLTLPEKVYVAEVVIDEKEVVAMAQEQLNFKRKKATSKQSLIRMALLLNGQSEVSWVYYEGKIFSFIDIENSGIKNIVDVGTIEELSIVDLSESDEIDNINLLKQLLHAHTYHSLIEKSIKMHPKDRFFFFQPYDENDKDRKEAWVGKKKAIRTVYEVKQQSKDPTKTAFHKHLCFDISYSKFEDDWYAHIVPSWYYSFNGHSRSRWHHDLLTKQKRLEYNQTVRNLVRFVAYFLSQATQEADLKYSELVELQVEDSNSEGTEEDLNDPQEEKSLAA